MKKHLREDLAMERTVLLYGQAAYQASVTRRYFGRLGIEGDVLFDCNEHNVFSGFCSGCRELRQEERVGSFSDCERC